MAELGMPNVTVTDAVALPCGACLLRSRAEEGKDRENDTNPQKHRGRGQENQPLAASVQ
jgi:hypothetical protein